MSSPLECSDHSVACSAPLVSLVWSSPSAERSQRRRLRANSSRTVRPPPKRPPRASLHGSPSHGPTSTTVAPNSKRETPFSQAKATEEAKQTDDRTENRLIIRSIFIFIVWLLASFVLVWRPPLFGVLLCSSSLDKTNGRPALVAGGGSGCGWSLVSDREAASSRRWSVDAWALAREGDRASRRPVAQPPLERSGAAEASTES